MTVIAAMDGDREGIRRLPDGLTRWPIEATSTSPLRGMGSLDSKRPLLGRHRQLSE